MAKHVTSRGIANEATFAWWVPYTLRKLDVIIYSITCRARKTSHKYGIKVPTNIKHVYRMDGTNKNMFWHNAFKKDILDSGISFEILHDDNPKKIHVVW